MGTVERAEKMLDVVAHFMGYDVGKREIAPGSEISRHILEKRQVDVDRLVGRAVERAYGCVGLTAAARGRSAVEHERRSLILQTILTEYLRPYILRAGHDLFGEIG